MENCIDAMVTRLGIDPDKGRRVNIPMSGPITDFTPLTQPEQKWFMSATGMIGWLAGTGRYVISNFATAESMHIWPALA